MSTLLQSPPAAGGLDMRVEDFLDDRLQSTTDLDSLDDLVAKVDQQRTQLQAQLDDATRQRDEAHRTARDRRGVLAERIAGFQELQDSIDRRVQVAAASDAPAQAIARLQEPLRRVQRLTVAGHYIALLRDVQRLRSEARAHLPQDPRAALEPYTQLRQLATRLEQLQGAADDGAGHLVGHVRAATTALWDEMKRIMADELAGVLARRKWPDVDPETEMDAEWLRSVEKLLDLQLPEVVDAATTQTVVTLLPFEVMARIFVSEFRFHFMSDRPTSSPQAISTHCFPWFLGTIEKWEDFFRDNLGHALAAKFRGTPAAGNPVYVDPVSALIVALLPVLREKVAATAAEAAKTPAFLSSLVSQLMGFDDAVRDKFGFDGGDAADGWAGLTSEVLAVHFETWFQAERSFALERFRAVVKAPDARALDYDYCGAGKTKPTHGAVRVTDLLRTVTTQYERARRFGHKLRFLIGIQLDILDEYHDLLRGSLERYQGLTSAVGRTLHGASREEVAALEGIGALETLCRVYGSADHVIATLKDWSNEEFFVVLWDQLQARAKNGSRARSRLSGEMSYDDVRDRTSAAVGSEKEDGAIFDETIAAYAARRKTALDFVVAALAESHHRAFRAYVTRTTWTNVGDSSTDPSLLAVSPELDEPLRVMKANLEFLHRTLGTAPFRRVLREALERMQDMLWTEVLMRQMFSAAGAAQFTRDVTALLGLAERYMVSGAGGGGGGGGVSAMAALREALVLLGLPVEVEGSGLVLHVASDRVFTDNAEAKAVLEDLGIENISPANARQILRRRVENGE